MRCVSCHNPEGIYDDLEVVTVQDRCIGCRECLEGCPESALSWQSGLIERDVERCSLCLNCVEICPSLAHEAHEAIGRRMGRRADIVTIKGESET